MFPGHLLSNRSNSAGNISISLDYKRLLFLALTLNLGLYFFIFVPISFSTFIIFLHVISKSQYIISNVKNAN